MTNMGMPVCSSFVAGAFLRLRKTVCHYSFCLLGVPWVGLITGEAMSESDAEYLGNHKADTTPTPQEWGIFQAYLLVLHT